MFKWFSLFCFFFSSQIVFAGDELFSTEIKINDDVNDNNISATQDTYTSLDNLIDAAMQTNLQGLTDSHNNSYDQLESKALINMNFRGILAVLEYKAEEFNGAANNIQYDTTLSFKIDAIQIDKSFCVKEVQQNNEAYCVSTRVDNENMFRDYLEDNKDGILDKITKYLVENDAFDPVTGPAGLIPSMASEDFGNAYDLVRGSDDGSPKASYSAGLEAGYFCTDDHCQSLITLPLNYTHYFEEPGKKLRLSAPISYLDVNGSKAYKGSLGVSLTKPMSDKWTVIPSARIGIIGSDDMGSSATVAALSVSNLYDFPYGDKHITLANMVGFQKSLDVKLGSLGSPYDLDTQVLKNGVTVEFPQRYRMFGGTTSLEVSLANTQFFGENLYVDNFTDIAISLGTRRKLDNKKNEQDSMHIGLTYTLGKHGYKGGKLNFGYKF